MRKPLLFSFLTHSVTGLVSHTFTKAPRSSYATVAASRNWDDLFSDSSNTQPVVGLPENLGLAYKQSGSFCLDVYFEVVNYIQQDRLNELLRDAWREDRLTTLKIIFQLGDPRNGKADRNNFNLSLVWLYKHDSELLLHNIAYIPTAYSYYRTLLDVLQIIMSGKGSHFLWYSRRNNSPTGDADRPSENTIESFIQSLPDEWKQDWNPGNVKESRRDYPSKRWVNDDLRELYLKYLRDKDRQSFAVARKKKRAEMKSKALLKLQTDGSYRRLHKAVSKQFAKGIIEERRNIEAGTLSISGLAAKWAPSPKGSHDKHTQIVRGIVEELYPEEEYRLSDGTYEEYLSFMTDRYRKEIVAQRRISEVPEHFIGSGSWDQVNYNRMPSLCRQRHGHIFEKHDSVRYHKFLEKAKEEITRGEKSTLIKAGAVLPHHIVEKALSGSPAEQEVANLQWLRLLQDTRAAGTLSSALAVADVSGSMYGEPLDVSVSLALLVSGVAERPWRNKIITFSRHPEFVQVEEASLGNLGERFATVSSMNWSMNTDFQAVFDLILKEALSKKVSPENMPKTVFCFSDMEFDDADSSATDVELIQRKYSRSGYEAPTLVFWNLRPSTSRPGAKLDRGIVFLSGSGAGLLKSFLNGDRLDEFTPQAEMMRMLQKYDQLSLPEASN